MQKDVFCMACRQISSLQQQAKLDQEAASETAAAAASLQQQNNSLSKQLQDLELRSSSAQRQASSDVHTQQVLVSGAVLQDTNFDMTNTTKQAS